MREGREVERIARQTSLFHHKVIASSTGSCLTQLTVFPVSWALGVILVVVDELLDQHHQLVSFLSGQLETSLQLLEFSVLFIDLLCDEELVGHIAS